MQSIVNRTLCTHSTLWRWYWLVVWMLYLASGVPRYKYLSALSGSICVFYSCSQIQITNLLHQLLLLSRLYLFDWYLIWTTWTISVLTWATWTIIVRPHKFLKPYCTCTCCINRAVLPLPHTMFRKQVTST